MGKAVNLRQAKPGTLADLFGREKRIENLGQKIRRNAGSGIAELKQQISLDIAAVIGRDVADRYTETAAVRHGIAGIDRNIDDGEFQLGKVDFHRPDVRIILFVVHDVAAQRAFDHRPHIGYAVIQIDHRRAQMLTARESQ